MKIIDYDLTSDISCLFGKRIYVYGTGTYGKKVATVLYQMKLEIEGFCETNPQKIEFLENNVLSIKTLIKNYDKSDVLIIVASEKYYKEMLYELQTVENIAVCTYYALFLSLYLNYEIEKIEESLKNNIKFFKMASLYITPIGLLGRAMGEYSDILSKLPLTWIYQPGKVASTSIHRSDIFKTYQMHSLAFAFNSDGDLPDICEGAIAKLKKGPIKIITGVREPISRDISLFFQGTDYNVWPLISYANSWIYLFGDYSRNARLDFQTLRKRICVFDKSLNQSFEHLCMEIIQNKSDEFSWFDYEIKALLGVDIYQYSFDKEKGYAVIEQDNIRILVYKCEKLSQLETVIGEFLEEPEFVLNNANEGKEKVYSFVYKGFKENVKLSKQYFDYYYANNPRLKHFYTDSEIEQFKKKWEKKL